MHPSMFLRRFVWRPVNVQSKFFVNWFSSYSVKLYQEIRYRLEKICKTVSWISGLLWEVNWKFIQYEYEGGFFFKNYKNVTARLVDENNYNSMILVKLNWASEIFKQFRANCSGLIFLTIFSYILVKSKRIFQN